MKAGAHPHVSVFPKATGTEAGGSSHGSLPRAGTLPSYRFVHLYTSALQTALRTARLGQSPLAWCLHLGQWPVASTRNAGGSSASCCCCFLGSCSSISSYSFAFQWLFCACPVARWTHLPFWHPQPSSSVQRKCCCVLENGSPSEMQDWILQLLKTSALVQQIKKIKQQQWAPSTHIIKQSMCLSAWLGWVSAQHLAGLSHYLCCNAPVPVGSGRG